ncbi:uncharacterized protein [Montipora foliosa]|uniref:uncharacterized protein n=1 Tax=Montipora foliosa TaxID=591990 RepID=UPI0035F13253
MASVSWQQSAQELGSNKVQVTLLASEWGSSKGGLSTINRELAIQLAKFPEVQITYFLLKCSYEDKSEAHRHGITILEATRLPGYDELEWLSFPPEHLQIDVVVGHGVKLGRQAQVIRKSHKCKWIQVIHTDPEELGMFKCYENPISRGEEKHNVEVELCKLANFVIGVGPKLAEAFRKYLRCCEKDQDVFDFAPGIFNEFVSVQQVPEERKQRSVLVFGRGDAEDFELKGFDIAATSVASLPDTHLVFVGAADGKHEEIANRLLECGVPKNRLRVRGYMKSRESLKELFSEVDLVLMPSRTEGFGLTGLEALSAGLPVIVSKNSGFGEALGNVPIGSPSVIDSEDPNVWTAAIEGMWNKHRQTRLDEAKALRDSYGKKYSWSEQCKDLLKKMIDLVNDASCELQMSSEAQGKLKRKSREDQKGHLTRKSTTGSSPQVGGSEVELIAFEEATRNGRIACESEDGVNEMNQKYEKLKALQVDLGDLMLRRWNITKLLVASNNSFVTKCNVEYQDNLTGLVASGLSLAGIITCYFTLGLGLFLTGAGAGAEWVKLLGKCSSKKREPELPQLANKLLQTDGQLKEVFHIEDEKRHSFNQCLDDIVEFCHEHPDKLVVLRECGHVSTQDILRDIDTFRSRLADFCSSIINSKEINKERNLGEEEEAIVANKEPGVIEDDSYAVIEEKMIMKLIRLNTAPVIVTTGKMKQ